LLEEILEHKSSIKSTPHLADGVAMVAPNLPGLPPLPPNGKCRVMEGFVIYFIPFFKPIDGVSYYKRILLFRLNSAKKTYKLVFSYTRKDFHITSASASNGYLVCSRLPYDANVLKIMEEAKKLKQKLWEKDENMRKQLTKLKSKNRYLSDRVAKAKQSALPRPYSAIAPFSTNGTFSTNKLARLELKVHDSIRSRDPVDLFAFDPERKTLVHVLEYHKPADHVNLQKRTLELWDKNSNTIHIFGITLLTKDVARFDFDDPLQPKKLCEEF